MRSAVLAPVLALCACNAQLADPVNTQSSTTDAPIAIDAAVTVDMGVDARACTGGQARGTDPSTGDCFVFFSAPVAYAQAEVNCAAIGGHLAVIKSAQTNTHVLSLVGQVNASIGTTDRQTEGTYLWLDNAADPINAGYTNWRSGEPNNGGTTGEDCTVIEGARNGTWDDKPCTDEGDAGTYAYVCQY